MRERTGAHVAAQSTTKSASRTSREFDSRHLNFTDHPRGKFLRPVRFSEQCFLYCDRIHAGNAANLRHHEARSCIRDLGEDEKAIFTSPLRLQPKDGYWLAPLGAATGLAIAYDADASEAVGVDPGRTNTANKIADFGSFIATGAEGAGIYFIGLAKKDSKLAETGRLADEAIIDSGTVTLVTKLASNRQRPRQGNGQGDFWPYGTQHWEWDSSFPSDHATASMALARVIAGEYPHWYVMVPAYGFAETISMSRIFANQHFPSDILVGQAVGFITGSYVLHRRSLYRPGAKKTLASRIIGSVNPIADARTRTLGASMEIPVGQ